MMNVRLYLARTSLRNWSGPKWFNLINYPSAVQRVAALHCIRIIGVFRHHVRYGPKEN